VYDSARLNEGLVGFEGYEYWEGAIICGGTEKFLGLFVRSAMWQSKRVLFGVLEIIYLWISI